MSDANSNWEVLDSYDAYPTSANKEVNNNTKENEAKSVVAGVGTPDEHKDNSKNTKDTKNTIDANRANNARNRASQDRITGTIELSGVPILKAGLCINVLNVGPRASGKWYVKTVDHEWDSVKGYTTSASLLRNQLPTAGKSQKSGKSPEKTGSPVTIRADIYKRGDVIVAPRDLDAEVQETFTYGDSDLRVISFSCSMNHMEKKGKDKAVGSDTHLVDAKKEVGSNKTPTNSPDTSKEVPPIRTK
jgi:hypothetical protein